MVLLQQQPAPSAAYDAGKPSPNKALKGAKSVPTLPAINPAAGTATTMSLADLQNARRQRLGLEPGAGAGPSYTPTMQPSYSQPLGLGPPDRSLLPDQQRQRRHKHVGCQTEETELANLRLLQEQLFAVRKELTSVNGELVHAERRLRAEVRDEMETRIAKFEKKTKEKVAFLKQRQENSTTTIRRASSQQLHNHIEEAVGTIKEQHARLREGEEREITSMKQRLEQQDLLIAGYKRENNELREQIEKVRESAGRGGGDAPSKKAAAAENGQAQLEAQLAQRDATIKALREQLARVQHGLPPTGEGGPPPLAQSQSLGPPSAMSGAAGARKR